MALQSNQAIFPLFPLGKSRITISPSHLFIFHFGFPFPPAGGGDGGRTGRLHLRGDKRHEADGAGPGIYLRTTLRFPIYEIKIFHFLKAYSALWRALSGGQKVTSAHARDLLDARFSGAAEAAERKRRKGRRAEEGGAVVVLVDELDKVGTGQT